MPRILVIDDDHATRNVLAMVLEDEGYAVVEAPDCIVGLRIHEAEPADLVITDIFMPGRDGFQCIARLRANHPVVPVIAISGADDLIDVDVLSIAKDFGANRTLAKPFAVQDLLGTVRDLLGAGPG